MTFRDVERQVWKEAKVVFCNSKLRLKHILEWSTSESAVKKNLQDLEVMASVPVGCWVAILKEHDKRK